MLAVVTGAAGHVGTNLCLDLLGDGHAVRAVDLREPTTAVRHGATWHRTDVRDEAAMREAFVGADLGFHLAALISVIGGQRGRVWSTNVDGVRAVAAAARASGLPRLVHVSSVHAYDVKAVGAPVDEGAPRAVAPTLPAYDRAKAAGEVELAEAVERGLDAVTINPTGIIGPLDESPSRMGTVLRALWRRRLPALVPGGFDWVDVRDVVRALRLAAERGRTGENYLIPGHRLSVAELAVAAARVGPVVDRLVPLWTVKAFMPIGELLARTTGSHLMPTREAMHALASFPRVSGAKAARELGYTPRPIDDTLQALHESFVTTGWLRRPHTAPPAPDRGPA
jgi:dihydroflavonol-4-reductase